MLKASSIQTKGRVLHVDLVILPIPHFDIILGMDWLFKYHAAIDCHRKVVIFQPPEEEQFIFEGTMYTSPVPIISILQA